MESQAGGSKNIEVSILASRTGADFPQDCPPERWRWASFLKKKRQLCFKMKRPAPQCWSDYLLMLGLASIVSLLFPGFRVMLVLALASPSFLWVAPRLKAMATHTGRRTFNLSDFGKAATKWRMPHRFRSAGAIPTSGGVISLGP